MSESKKWKTELIGLNIPEYFDALRSAASLAHGFYWKPMEVWQSRESFTKFMVCRKDYRPDDKEWLKVTTVTPHARKTH
jgi:hypothetical protein